MEDKLEDLFTDNGLFNEQEIVNFIKPYVVIQKNSFDIYFNNVDKFNTDEKILLYLLTKKLLKFKGYISDETISALEFYKKTGIKKGTIDPSFKNLRESRLIVGSGNNYEIPNIMLPEVIKRLKNKK